MGELVDLNLSPYSREKECPNCGMKETESNGCCHDEQQLLKLDKEQKTVKGLQLIPQLTCADVINPVTYLASNYTSTLMGEHSMSNVPPRRQYALSLFIQNCVFRI